MSGAAALSRPSADHATGERPSVPWPATHDGRVPKPIRNTETLAPRDRRRLETRFSSILADLHAALREGAVVIACTICIGHVVGMENTEDAARDLASRIVSSHRARSMSWGHSPVSVWGLERDARTLLHLHVVLSVPRGADAKETAGNALVAREGIERVIGPITGNGRVWNGTFGYCYDGKFELATDAIGYALKTTVPEGVQLHVQDGAVVRVLTGAAQRGPRPSGRVWASSRPRLTTPPIATSTPRRKARLTPRPQISADDLGRWHEWRKEAVEARLHGRAASPKPRFVITYSAKSTPSAKAATINEEITVPTTTKPRQKRRITAFNCDEVSICRVPMHAPALIAIVRSRELVKGELEAAVASAREAGSTALHATMDDLEVKFRRAADRLHELVRQAAAVALAGGHPSAGFLVSMQLPHSLLDPGDRLMIGASSDLPAPPKEAADTMALHDAIRQAERALRPEPVVAL